VRGSLEWRQRKFEIFIKHVSLALHAQLRLRNFVLINAKSFQQLLTALLILFAHGITLKGLHSFRNLPYVKIAVDKIGQFLNRLLVGSRYVPSKRFFCLFVFFGWVNLFIVDIVRILSVQSFLPNVMPLVTQVLNCIVIDSIELAIHELPDRLPIGEFEISFRFVLEFQDF
jgi:hypothetical protein